MVRQRRKVSGARRPDRGLAGCWRLTGARKRLRPGSLFFLFLLFRDYL
jgi:hypothetical protein